MAEIRNFHNFESFKACREFVKAIGLTLRKPQFRSDRILTAQMQRASISVLSNFAEGFEREGNTEFIQFLSVSKGSVGELRAQLIYSLDLGLLEERPFDELDALGESATRLLGGSIRYLGKSEKRGRKYDTRKRKARGKRRTGRSRRDTAA
jgi:four helix bundle protein